MLHHPARHHLSRGQNGAPGIPSPCSLREVRDRAFESKHFLPSFDPILTCTNEQNTYETLNLLGDIIHIISRCALSVGIRVRPTARSRPKACLLPGTPFTHAALILWNHHCVVCIYEAVLVCFVSARNTFYSGLCREPRFTGSEAVCVRGVLHSGSNETETVPAPDKLAPGLRRSCGRKGAPSSPCKCQLRHF